MVLIESGMYMLIPEDVGKGLEGKRQEDTAVYWDYHNKIMPTEYFMSNGSLFLCVLETGRFKIKLLSSLVGDENQFIGLWTDFFESLSSHG